MNQINEIMQLKKSKKDTENEFDQEKDRLNMDKLKFAELNSQLKQSLNETVSFFKI